MASAKGAFALGNPGFRFDLSGADPAPRSAAFNLNAVAPPLKCGICFITPPLITITLPIQNGSAAMPLAVPCDYALVGGAVEAQWIVLGTTASPRLVRGVSFSSRLSATVGL